VNGNLLEYLEGILGVIKDIIDNQRKENGYLK
jgi:hypothetical protein